MKINDLEKLTGLKRSNIFYYEREGLLFPRREDNNYREYGEEDLRRLKTIVVFRKLGFTVAEIKELLDGERELIDMLPENMARLEEKSAALAGAMTLCRDMERQGLTMESFDPDAWFEIIESEERQGAHFMDMLGDVADDFTKTLAFVQDSIGLRGPVYAYFFLSEEGIRKRRLWKLYWALCLGGYLLLLAETYLLPGHYIRLESPLAALVYTLVDGVIGSLVLVLCARYVIPGRKPRQALWLTIALMMSVNLCLGFLSRQAYRTEVDEEAQARWQYSIGQGYYVGDDPVDYVQTAFNQKYYGGNGELDTWEDGDTLFVFTSWGRCYIFGKSDDGLWTEYVSDHVVDGTLYTADPVAPRKYPSRLMLSDGTAVTPAYEAHFSTGYMPLYAFDVSDGQEYAAIEYGVDGAGGQHYEIERIEYSGASDWTNTPRYNEKKITVSAASLVRTSAGANFLTAYRAWRGEIWRGEPTMESDAGTLGVSSDYALWAVYYAPPSLTIRLEGSQAQTRYTVDWEPNEFSECIYLPEDREPYYTWQRLCGAEVIPLLLGEEATPEMLRYAALTAETGERSDLVLDPGDLMRAEWVPYRATRYWKVTLPAELIDLGGRTFSEINGVE